MKITPRLFERVLVSVESDTDTHPTTIRRVLLSAFDSLGIEIEQEPAIVDEMIWVVRSWLDVRDGDIIRPPGAAGNEAIASNVGPVNHWHASPNASQYRPNESPAEWASINVTLTPLPFMGASPAPFTPPHGMKPDAPVEIRVTRAELAAIEACGGWVNRVGITQ